MKITKLTREEMIKHLKENWHLNHVNLTEDWYGSEDQAGGLVVSGEDGTEHPTDGLEIFNYYAEDYKEVVYQFGVHKGFKDWLEVNGWMCEWYDAGTIMIYPEFD